MWVVIYDSLILQLHDYTVTKNCLKQKGPLVQRLVSTNPENSNPHFINGLIS